MGHLQDTRSLFRGLSLGFASLLQRVLQVAYHLGMTQAVHLLGLALQELGASSFVLLPVCT